LKKAFVADLGKKNQGKTMKTTRRYLASCFVAILAVSLLSLSRLAAAGPPDPNQDKQTKHADQATSDAPERKSMCNKCTSAEELYCHPDGGPESGGACGYIPCVRPTKLPSNVSLALETMKLVCLSCKELCPRE
jgi:hypothetical protein